jgi:DNA-binding transcriptional LysR family regulator
VSAVDLDLRQLRYFVAVAERLHFGRAAASLYITQPALSRQIRQLEQDLGVSLFARTSRDVTLTPAGEQLAHDATRLLAASHGAVYRARRASGGEEILTIGFMLSTDLDPALSAFSVRHPGVDVRLKRVRWWNQAQMLVEGSVDAAFVRLPVESEGLTLVPLYTESICVALPADHPLAGTNSAKIADLADEPVLVYADATSSWNAFWTIEPRPHGAQPAQGPAVHDMEEIIEYVRVGRGVVFLPTAVTEAFPRDDIAYISVIDIPPGQVALAWDDSRESSMTLAFVEAARTTVRNHRT